MNILKTITTPLATVEQCDNGVFIVNIPTGNPSIEDGEKHLQMIQQEFGISPQNPMASLIRMGDIKKSGGNAKGLRDFFSQKENAQYFCAAAFVITSPLAKIAINLFMKFTKPGYPTKAFAREDAAIEWLQSELAAFKANR